VGLLFSAWAALATFLCQASPVTNHSSLLYADAGGRAKSKSERSLTDFVLEGCEDPVGAHSQRSLAGLKD
jgi:hypothetical protein